MTDRIYDELKSIVSPDRVLRDEPMSLHTTFKIGGPCDIFVSVAGMEEAENVIRLLSVNEVPYYIIGNGSNLLVCDEGYRGVIVEFGKSFSDVTVDGERVIASAGALLVRVANEACKAGLTGLEFASGIPGTIGGAVFMNAGAYGGELKDITESVTVFDTQSLKLKELSCEEMEFSYRHSICKDKPYIILKAVIKLAQGDTASIRARMDELKEQRNLKQPLEYPSAGSTFKRPEGYFAGKLIQDSGLKGYKVGGAMISEKHSGFVINADNATAVDVMSLISDVRKTVYDKFGVNLEPEVVILK